MVRIETYTTSARIYAKPHSEPDRLIREYLREKLLDYKREMKRGMRFPRTVEDKHYYFYDDGAYVIPVNFAEMFYHKLRQRSIPVQLEDKTHTYITPRKVDVNLKEGISERDHQIVPVKTLVSSEKHRVGLTSGTGRGKTAMSIISAVKRGEATMIMCSGLLEQWEESIHDFTDIGDDLYVIQGAPSIKKLFKLDKRPKWILASTDTIRSYIKGGKTYKDVPSYEEMLEWLGIGFKIIDEVHEKFYMSTMIDFRSNVKFNLYLTATFVVNNKDTRRIFNTVYPRGMQIGSGQDPLHTNAYFYVFSGVVPERVCNGGLGYSHIAYEKWLNKRPKYREAYHDNIIWPMVQTHYIEKKQKGERLIIFFELHASIDACAEYIRKEFPEVSVLAFKAGIDKRLLNTHDVVIATHGGAGTGTDIKNVLTVFNTISFKAEGRVQQVKGRIRYRPGRETTYVDIGDRHIESQMRHMTERVRLLRPLCKTVSKGYLDPIILRRETNYKKAA